MTLQCTTGARMRSFKDRGTTGASVVTPPLIDRSKVAASLLLRCDQSASVSIHVTGLPLPQVTWYIGSTPIGDSSEFRVAKDADGRKHTLAVARVSEDLEGGLKVKAVNCAGQDQWEFEVKTYKLFSGRSQSDGNKFTTLPLLKSTGKRKGSSTPSPKTLQKKTSRRFEMTADEYEDWQKEMERRSHMRSIDDILESLSDDDPQTEDHSPSTANKTKSEENNCVVMETHPSSSSSTSFAPLPPPSPPTRHSTSGSFQEQLSSESRARGSAFRDGPPTGSDMPRKPDTALCITRVLSSTAELRNSQSSSELENGIPLWEMFGVKLSEFCRTILASTAVDFAKRQSDQGVIRHSTIQSRGDHISEGIPRPTMLQSRSVPVGRKDLGSRLPEKQIKLDNTRIPVSKDRLAQQRTPTQSEDQQNPVTLMPDDQRTPNLRPPIRPKGDTTQRVSQTSEGSGSPNTRPPLAPKPCFKEERQVRGSADVKDEDSKAVKGDSFDGFMQKHRKETEPLNSVSNFTPKAHTSQRQMVYAALDRSERRDNACEPLDKDSLLQRSSSLDRKQNLVEWVPAVDRHFAEVRVETQRRRLEIRNPSSTGEEVLSSAEILETHFNEPVGGCLQTTHETFIAGQEQVSKLIPIVKANGAEGSSISLPAPPLNVIRKKPPIAKDKPFWNPTSGTKGRGTLRSSPSLSSKAEHVENGSKQHLWSLQPTMNSEPQSVPSKPTLVRRARSQSSGRSDGISGEEEEDTSHHPLGATTSSLQLSYSQEPSLGNPTQRSEQFLPSGIRRFQASAAKSEGLLTARKRSGSPTATGAVDQNGGAREWRGVRMPVSKSVDLLDAADSMESMQRIGRRSLSKEWHVVTVTTKEEITILHRPEAVTTFRTEPTTNNSTITDRNFTYRPQLRPSKPFAV